jgi:hypothetical protein
MADYQPDLIWLYYQSAEIREQINAALAKLSPEHRAVVVLKELDQVIRTGDTGDPKLTICGTVGG